MGRGEKTSTQGHLSLKCTISEGLCESPAGVRVRWMRACGRVHLFHLAGSPSLKAVSLTFSIQVSGLMCRSEHFFLLQRSQTGRRGGTSLPALLLLPRRNEREVCLQN